LKSSKELASQQATIDHQTTRLTFSNIAYTIHVDKDSKSNPIYSTHASSHFLSLSTRTFYQIKTGTDQPLVQYAGPQNKAIASEK